MLLPCKTIIIAPKTSTGEICPFLNNNFKLLIPNLYSVISKSKHKRTGLYKDYSWKVSNIHTVNFSYFLFWLPGFTIPFYFHKISTQEVFLLLCLKFVCVIH